MQLGLFFTGVSPSGGASNTWSVILGGNLDLSISMTTISTLKAFVMMPLWIFTLGRTIFNRDSLPVPYQRIATFAIGLIVPLFIGILIQRYLPRVAKLLVRILKTCSSLLIIFIIVFAIVTNLYLFQLFTWQVSSTSTYVTFVVAFTYRSMFECSLLITLSFSLLLLLTKRYLLPAWHSRGSPIWWAGVLQRYSNKNTRIVLLSLSKREFRIPVLLFISFARR